LYNSAGTQIGSSSNPTVNAPGVLNTSLTINLAAGSYFISIDGTGAGDKALGGYSAYASIGSYSITGTIPPIVTNLNPDDNTYNAAPMVSITSPSNGTMFNAPASFAIIAHASDSNGYIAKVEFYNGAQKIGEDVTAPYTCHVRRLAAGKYFISAVAKDNQGVSASASIGITITAVTADNCGSIAQYKENNGYVGGSQVQNAGRKHECKEWPYSGWCNGAAWAYAPGTGTYWTDAWYDRGSCSARIASDAGTTNTADTLDMLPFPNPVLNRLSLESQQDLRGGKVKILSSLGMEVLTVESYSSALDVSNLPSGAYIVVWSRDSNTITKHFVK